MAEGDIPRTTNVFGHDMEFDVNNDVTGTRQAYYTYKTNSTNSCARLSSGLSSNMEGISSLGVSKPDLPNPVCGNAPPRLFIRQD